jgi:hypothetical protein
MHRRIVLAGMAALLASAPGLRADDTAAEIARVEDTRFAAMQAGDVGTLDGLLAPELTYTHSNAKVETKAEFLEAIRSGSLKYLRIVPSDTNVRVYGDTAVRTGRCAFEVEMGGQTLKPVTRFTDVYVRSGGSWRLVAWQSTRIPEP